MSLFSPGSSVLIYSSLRAQTGEADRADFQALALLFWGGSLGPPFNPVRISLPFNFRDDPLKTWPPGESTANGLNGADCFRGLPGSGLATL